MPDWKHIVRAHAGGEPLDPDLVDEIAQHAEESYRTAVNGGASHPQALAAVELEMESVPALARAARSLLVRPLTAAPEPLSGSRWRVLAAFARDLARSVRLLAARPGLTAIAVVTLALGTGANTAIFSVVHSLLLAPLPFHDPDRLVMIWESERDDPSRTFIVSAPNWKDWRAASRSFDEMAIWEFQSFNVGAAPDPEQIPGMRVSSTLFAMLGVPPQLGRTFLPEEDAPGHHVVVISDSVWRRRFAGRPDAIGSTLKLNGESYEIIGVMPPSFQFTQPRFGLWVPIAFNANDADRSSHSFYAAGRLKEDVSFDTAKAEIEALGRALETQYPENRGEAATITRMDELGVSSLRPTLRALTAAVALVLLIACVNVANLLLAQGAARHRELAIRAALGAGRGRIASQLLAEGLLLALAGGGLGVLLALFGTAALDQSLPPSIRFAPFRLTGGTPLNAPVLLFTCLLALATGVLFSLAPIVSLSGINPGRLLKSGDRGGTLRSSAFRTVLVGIEVALAVVVLAAAGLMIKSVARLAAVDPGLDAHGVLLMDIALPQTDFYGPPERTGFCDDVAREVGSLPGVVAAGAASHVPLEGNASRGFAIEGRPAPKPKEGANANYRLTCPGYFTALGIPILRGRDFTSRDTITAPGVVIINEQTARRYWPGEDPLGRRLKLGGFDSTNPWLTIVGISRDVHHFGLDADARREMFRPYSQAAWPVMSVAVKTASPMAMVPAVRAALARIDPDQPVSRVRTMEQVVADSMGGRRFPMLLLGVFSVVALALAGIGVYGVASCTVSQRTREIGIRVALGAAPSRVLGFVVGRSIIPILVGLAVGGAAALVTSRLLSSLLFEVTPSDPIVLGGILMLLGFAAAVASFVPARRAAGVDPLIVLKDE